MNFTNFTMQKELDEGTSSPFIARLMNGVMELRDQFLNLRPLNDQDRDATRMRRKGHVNPTRL